MMISNNKEGEKLKARRFVSRCRSFGSFFGGRKASNRTSSVVDCSGPNLRVEADASPSKQSCESQSPVNRLSSNQEKRDVEVLLPRGQSQKPHVKFAEKAAKRNCKFPNRVGHRLTNEKPKRNKRLTLFDKMELSFSKKQLNSSQRTATNVVSAGYPKDCNTEVSGTLELLATEDVSIAQRTKESSVHTEIKDAATARSTLKKDSFKNNNKKDVDKSAAGSQSKRPSTKISSSKMKLDPRAPEFIPSHESTKRLTRASTSSGLQSPSNEKVRSSGLLHIFRRSRDSRDRSTDDTSSIQERGAVSPIKSPGINSLEEITNDKEEETTERFEAPEFPTSPCANLIDEIGTNPSYTAVIEGFEVTRVDQGAVFIVDLVPPQICDLILQLTNDHVEKSGSRVASGNWRKLYTYTTMDMPCREVRFLGEIVDQIVASVVQIVREVYGLPSSRAELCPRTWKEPHLLRYQKVEGKPVHTGTELHWDGCHVTWQLMLSDQSEYSGGGTYFSEMERIVKLKKGQVLIHPGSMYHKGVDITDGIRMLLVCFMDWFDTAQFDGAPRPAWNDEIEAWEESLNSL